MPYDIEKTLRAELSKVDDVMEFASKVGLNSSTLYRFRSGSRSLNLASASKLCKALKVKLVPPEKSTK